MLHSNADTSPPFAASGFPAPVQAGVKISSPAPEHAIRGWASRLAVFVTALLLIQAATGLWIYLAPFSTVSQVQLLLHAAAGLIFLGPYFWFQARHLAVWMRQKLTAVMVLGYLLMAAVLTCIASGLVLTWQAGAGPKLSRAWDLVHLVSGIMTPVLLIFHLALAWKRRAAALRSVPAFKAAVGRHAAGAATLVAGGAAAVVLAALALPSSRSASIPIPEGYSFPVDLDRYEEYRGSPFAPTYARTETVELVDPALLAGSESCGSAGCHREIYREWLPSAHRFSAMNPPFQAVQREFAADRGAAETRYCAGCHDPISLFAGAKDIHQLDLSAPGMQEGASCVVCHSISKVDKRGNADYVLTPPSKYLWEGERGAKKWLSDFLIRAYPRQHLADYDRNLLRAPEYCGACHKQFIPEALNRFGESPGQNQYDEWRTSHWHSDDPQQDLSCRDCHMRLIGDSTDPGRGERGDRRRGAGDKAHRHHGFIATNFFMPAVLKLPGWEEQVRLTQEWIRGETVLPEIERIWPAGPVASIKLNSPASAGAGEELELNVEVQNRKAGHNFITGPLDFIRSWVHLSIVDARGRTLFERGNIDPKTREICDQPEQVHEIGNSRREGTLVLEGMPLDPEGRLIIRHELWRKAGGKGNRIIFPGYTDHQSYRFKVPENAAGPLTVKAELCFRRYRQEFLDLVVPEMEKSSGVFQPSVIQAAAEKAIEVVPAGNNAAAREEKSSRLDAAGGGGGGG
jgi:hypothetical protein